MPDLTDAKITGLLPLFEPLLFFDPSEQFFPSVAEELLDHQGTENWNKVGSHQRGTAVLLVPLSATSFSASDVKAGSDDPNGATLKLDSGPNGIGQPFGFDSTKQDLFLDCAGWDDTPSEANPGDPTFTSGSIDYLQKLFSGLGNAMNNSIPLATPQPPPKFDFPRSTSPTVYAELEWAGRYPVLDQIRVQKIGGTADFPTSIGGADGNKPGPLSALNNYLALTYHLFYPAMETSPVAAPNPDVDRLREGQWEAITVFLKGDPDFGTTDADGRPDFSFTLIGEPVVGSETPVVRGLTPRFVAYSQGYGLGDDNFNPLAAEVRPWVDPMGRSAMAVEHFHSHPLAYVTAGTHRNLYSLDAIVTPGPSQPNPALNTTGGAVMGAAGSVAGICAGIAELPPAAVACIVVAAVAFFIGLILFILSFLFQSSSPPTESPQSTQPGTDVARDDGPAGIPSDLGGTWTGPSSAVHTTLRFISDYKLDPTAPVSTYPLPAAGVVESPSWWSFAGRWGVRVMRRASAQWDSGTRRTDPFGRSRAYWNTYQLVAFLGDAERAVDGIGA